MTDYEKFQSLYKEIDTLAAKLVTSSSPDFITWKTKTDRFLLQHFGDGKEVKDFRSTYFSPIVYPTTTEREIAICREALLSTKAVFQAYLEEMKDEMKDEIIFNQPEEKTDFSKVFVVHGHNGELKLEIARLIEKVGITPVILSEQANQGATIIEKIERYGDVGAAICLFTADDIGKAKGESDSKNRARQNVVFEAGYFMGKLGRNKVVMIADSSVEIPSDLSGVVYSNDKNWEVQVLKELKEIGFKIDFNKYF